MIINISKSQFGHDSIDFLEHFITHISIMLLADKVDAITCFQLPVTIKGQQEFVGMANFYRRFILVAAQIMLPLFEALAGKPRTLVWSKVIMKAFQDTKKALAEATLLNHPHHDVLTSLTADASDKEVGTVLQQFVNGTWEPLAFFSKKLQPPKRKYSTSEGSSLLQNLYGRVCRSRWVCGQNTASPVRLPKFAHTQKARSRGSISPKRNLTTFMWTL